MKYIILAMLIFSGCGRGPVGAAGPKGDAGVQGQQGEQGVDASPVTTVQFCPGTTTYPSAFLEIGLRIGNKLIAVYSANNGFLVELPPGRYSSNAIGSRCNFTVNADLSITN
jgi:hypothetical protein